MGSGFESSRQGIDFWKRGTKAIARSAGVALQLTDEIGLASIVESSKNLEHYIYILGLKCGMWGFFLGLACRVLGFPELR